MSIWMFIFLCFCSWLVIAMGREILEKTSKRRSNALIFFNKSLGYLCVFGGVLMIGYGIYQCFIFDYTKAIEKAIVNHDYEKAHELLFDMSQDSGETNEISWGVEHKSNYQIAFEKVFKAEVTYLLNQGDRQASDKLISLVGNLPIEATPTIGITDNKQTQKKNEDYSIYVGKFNGICDDILHNAISVGNKYLAEKILVMYKPTLIRTLEESKFFSTNAYRYVYTNEMQTAAQERFNKAVSTGLFP